MLGLCETSWAFRRVCCGSFDAFWKAVGASPLPRSGSSSFCRDGGAVSTLACAVGGAVHAQAHLARRCWLCCARPDPGRPGQVLRRGHRGGDLAAGCIVVIFLVHEVSMGTYRGAVALVTVRPRRVRGLPPPWPGLGAGGEDAPLRAGGGLRAWLVAPPDQRGGRRQGGSWLAAPPGLARAAAHRSCWPGRSQLDAA